MYSGVSVEGTWRLSDGDEKQAVDWSQVETLRVNQNASRLTGTQTLSAKLGEPVSSALLDISGGIRDRFVYMTFTAQDRRRLGIGVLLGELVGDGTKIVGHSVYYDTLGKRVDSTRVEYQRIPAA